MALSNENTKNSMKFPLRNENFEKEDPSNSHPITLFFILAFSIGFGFILLVLATGIFAFAYVAAASSSLAGIITAWITKGKKGITDLLAQFKNWRCNPLYYIFAIFFPFCAVIVAVLVSLGLGGVFPLITTATWVSLAPNFTILLFQAGFGEEIGWRGYVTPQLAKYHKQVPSALLIGIGWAFWHIPLFLMPGFPQYYFAAEVGFAVALSFYGTFIALSAIVYTWLFYKSGRNLWLPVILHASLNTFSSLISTNLFQQTINSTIWMIASVLVVLVFGTDFDKKLQKEGPK